MESQCHGTGWTSQSCEGEISSHSANESEPETDGEIEVIIDDEDTDEECNVHGDINEIEHGEWQNEEHDEDNIEKPHVGMLFDSAEDAYQFYNRYAMEVGFSIRKGSSRRSRKNDVVIWRQFLCYKEGWRREKNKKSEGTKVKHRREIRVGCQANLVVKLQVEDGKWVVTIFEEKHNHNFEKCRLLPSHRNIDGSEGYLTHSMNKAGIKTNLMMNYLSEEAGGSRNVGFIGTGWTSHSYEGEISAHSGNESEPEADDEIEVIIDDGDTDEECNVHGDINEIEHTECQNKEHEEVNIEKPHVGMVFDSTEDAYQFYNRYAREMGFSIRRGSSRRSRKNDAVVWRQFLCYKEGWRREKNKKAEGTKVKHRCEIRVGCQANLVVKLQVEDGTWVIIAFEEKHNHNFEKRRLLPSHRKIDGSQEDLIHSLSRSGIKTNRMMNYSSEEAGENKSVGSIDRDVRKMELKKEDAQTLLKYFNKLQDSNPNFFYAFQLDRNSHLTNFFWTDAISRMDYNYFGEVVCMDATYGTTKYNMPFVPIVGVNHHLQTTYFGGALILNETEASYVWVLETWMKAMKGSHPKTILTEQDSAMSGAIARVLPHTRHLYCLWHIFQNAQKHLGHLYTQNCSFANEFSNCIYNNETIEEFEQGWEILLAKHNLHGNIWMSRLYAKRQQWVPVFSKDIFRADMATTHRGESINMFFEDFLKKDMLVQKFVRAVDKALVHRRKEELRFDYLDNSVLPCRKAYVQVEEDLGKIYTKSVFEKFQDELLLSLRFMSEKVEDDGTTSTFRCWLQNKEYIVKLCLNDSSCRCSCQKFEYTGILCSHILKVYSVTNIVKIPLQYILKRWTRFAKCGIVANVTGEQIQADCQMPFFLRHNSLCHRGMEIAAKGAASMEVYRVAKHWLDKTLEEVENALKRTSPGCIGSNKDDAAQVSRVGGSNNQVVIRYPPIVPRIESCLEKNHKRKLLPREKKSSGVAQNPSELERQVDQRTEKKHKENPPGATKKKESKGPNVSALILEAPIEQHKEMWPFDVYGTNGSVDLNSNFNQVNVVTNMQLMHNSSHPPHNDGSNSIIGLGQLSQGNNVSYILDQPQFHDGTNIQFSDPSHI